MPAYIQCKLCSKDFSGPEPYAEHLVSKAHLQKMEERGHSTPQMLSSDSGAKEKHYCDVCEVELSGPVPLEQHYGGSKHRSMLNKKRILLEQGVSQPNESANGTLRCETCEKCFSGPESFEAHVNSKKHQRKMEMTDFKDRLTNQEPASCPPVQHIDDDSSVEQSLYPSLPTKNMQNHSPLPTRNALNPVIPNRAQGSSCKPKKPPGCFTAFRDSFRKNKNRKKKN